MNEIKFLSFFIFPFSAPIWCILWRWASPRKRKRKRSGTWAAEVVPHAACQYTTGSSLIGRVPTAEPRSGGLWPVSRWPPNFISYFFLSFLDRNVFVFWAVQRKKKKLKKCRNFRKVLGAERQRNAGNTVPFLRKPSAHTFHFYFSSPTLGAITKRQRSKRIMAPS